MDKNVLVGAKRYIYIVLIKAHTGLGKFARFISQYEYTHIAVSFDSSMTDFVTFSRKKQKAPFDAGFTHEKREHYAFGNHKNVKVKIYKIPVSLQSYENIVDFVKQIECDDEYVFNLYSMLTMSLIHGIPIYKAYNCMSFVAKVLELSGAVCMDREYFRYDIHEIDELLSMYSYTECYLRRVCEDEKYVKPVSLPVNISMFVKLNRILIYRFIFRRKCIKRPDV